MSTDTGQDNKFLYNGKEHEDDFDLNWYHYGVRYYDQQLGKWLQIDPVDEFHSPYVYCANNPIMFIDPDGSAVAYAFTSARWNVGYTEEYLVGRAIGYDNGFKGIQFSTDSKGGSYAGGVGLSGGFGFLFGTNDPNSLLGRGLNIGVSGLSEHPIIQLFGCEVNIIRDRELDKWYVGLNMSMGKAKGSCAYIDHSNTEIDRNAPYSWESKFYYQVQKHYYDLKNSCQSLTNKIIGPVNQPGNGTSVDQELINELEQGL